MTDTPNHAKPTECLHNTLYFGSGDYYILCKDCHRSWVMREMNRDVADVSESNIGEASQLSGEERVKPT